MSLNIVPDNDGQDVAGIAGKRLVSFIERIERMEEEKTAVMEDIKEIYGEAKATGFDVKIVRKIVKLRSMDTEKRHEEEELLNIYKEACGLS